LTIEQAFDTIKGQNLLEGEKEYLIPHNNVFTPCINNECDKVQNEKIKMIYRHKVTKMGFKVTTKSGKSVHVTADHSLMVLRDGVLLEVKATELKRSDKLINLR